MTGPPEPEEIPFWRRKRLHEMTPAEWEALCDGCGRCCLQKLQADDTPQIYHLDVACALQDTTTGRCTDYPNRLTRNVGCAELTPATVLEFDWMPPTCAYRLVSQGRDLEWWHPLVSGDPASVRDAGMSVVGRVVAFKKAGPHENHTVDWPQQSLPTDRHRMWTLALFGGINASVPTPFDNDGRVDLDLMAAHCLWRLANGCHGVAVLDKTGEVSSLAVQERIGILQGLVSRDVPPSKILAGIGVARAGDVTRISECVAQLGIRGVILNAAGAQRILPSQVLPRSLCKLVALIPAQVSVYLSMRFPAEATAAGLTALEAFMANAPGRLRGIRDETFGCSLGFAALDRFDMKRFEVYTEDETTLQALIERGGAGSIGFSANLLGRLYREIIEPTKPELVPRIQRTIEVAGIAMRSAAAVPAIKALLARQSGDHNWERMRLPLRPLRPTEREKLFREFDASGIRLERDKRSAAQLV